MNALNSKLRNMTSAGSKNTQDFNRQTYRVPREGVAFRWLNRPKHTYGGGEAQDIVRGCELGLGKKGNWGWTEGKTDFELCSGVSVGSLKSLTMGKKQSHVLGSSWFLLRGARGGEKLDHLPNARLVMEKGEKPCGSGQLQVTKNYI